MKKFFLTSTLLGLALAASAQPFYNRSFLASGISSFNITNAGAAPFGGYTNTKSFGYLAPYIIPTNSYNFSYTNSSGTRIMVTNNTPVAGPTGITMITNDTTAITVDVPLYSRRDGSVGFTSVSNSISGGPNSMISDYNLSVTLVGDTNALTTAVTFIYVPVCDGSNESTIAADTWNIAFAPTTNSPVTLITNVPIWKWPGCKALRLKSATFPITATNNAAVTVLSMSLNGFVP